MSKVSRPNCEARATARLGWSYFWNGGCGEFAIIPSATPTLSFWWIAAIDNAKPGDFLTRNSSRSLEIPITLLVVTCALVAITNIPILPDTRFFKALQNFGHAPLFGAAAVVIARAFLRREQRTHASMHSLLPFWIALGIALLLGAGTEMVQGLLGGDAEVQDVIADTAGAASFLAIHWSIAAANSRGWRWLARIPAAALLGWCAVPVMAAGTATWHRNRIFPILADFNSRLGASFYAVRNARCEPVPAPSGAELPLGNRMAKITFEPAQYPSFFLEEPYPDWTGYKDLRFLVYSELPGPITLAIRIHDAHHNNETADRFNAALAIKPGLNPIRIPLRDIESAPSGRRMDMRAIRSLMIFAIAPSMPVTVFVGDLRLGNYVISLPFDDHCAEHYAMIRAELAARGQLISHAVRATTKRPISAKCLGIILGCLRFRVRLRKIGKRSAFRLLDVDQVC